MEDRIKQIVQDSIDVKEEFFSANMEDIIEMIDVTTAALKAGRKIIVFGNGGSAADAQHLAGELVNRFMMNRRAIPAIALTVDTSVITSIGNDVGYDDVFSRQVEALGAPGDIAIAISTSGNSPNIIKAVHVAQEKNCYTIGFLGKDGGRLKELVDLPLIVKTNETARIQETHITLIHVFCEFVEKAYAEF